MNSELIEALNILEREKDINKDVLLDAIENSLVTAYKNHFDKADNVKVNINRETGDFTIFSEKKVVEKVENPVTEISLEAAMEIDKKYKVDDIVNVEVKTKEFGRIATSVAKSVITQKIREEEKSAVFKKYYAKEKDILTGIVQKTTAKGIIVNLGKLDALLGENDIVKTEKLRPNDRIKVYVTEVKEQERSSIPKVMISRTHEQLVKRLFETEVAEIMDGIVEIVTIARDPGSRSKISVRSKNPKVDPVGSCVGVNGSRVGAVVAELRGEKIDIVRYSDNSAEFIENALSPSKVISVEADDDEKSAKVVVPDHQLSLAIGRAGQNAKLAAKLTGYRIDIKSESQARELAEAEEKQAEEEAE
ncbi:MAG: transcription termination/antitermination protein NusA [Lachnospiraceae bacterium]|nr:transcription termination/antitermination protein NusA [Lachnospiraceae bacterium]